MRLLRSVRGCVCFWLLLQPPVSRADTSFTVGTFNVENYLDAPSGTRQRKPDSAKAVVRESIRQLNADILALEEIGAASALQELLAALAREGLTYPHRVFVEGYDTNIHIAVLSRLPIVRDRSHTNDAFLLHGRRYHASRGFAEIDFRISSQHTLTLFAAHLKSRREVSYADQAELREQEALLLRAHVDARLRSNPSAWVILAGDLNDLKNSKAIRTLIGRGQSALVDLRPVEQPRRPQTNSGVSARNGGVAWTHFFAKEDTYSRVDYLLASRRLAGLSNPRGSFVLALDHWGEASDHRPLVARFTLPD